MSELKATPGPWRWEISSGTVRLRGGKPRYDLTVIDFVRKGMNDATVRFRENTPGWNIMHKAQSFAVPAPGREHHEWFCLIDQPDAHLIAAAPDLYAALEFADRVRILLDHDNEQYPKFDSAISPESPWEDYYVAKWAKVDELFPDLGAKYPLPSEAEASDWSGGTDSPAEVRNSMYSEALDEELGEMMSNLRRAALAKARGEGQS